MRTKLILCSSVAALSLAIGLSISFADDKAKPTDKKPYFPECPISDKEINFRVHTDTDSGRVYFCCGMCIDKYKKSASRYTASVKVQQKVVGRMAKVQVVCPTCDAPPAKDVTADYDGKKLGFCCKECAAKFSMEPEKYAKKIPDCYTYQTTCPVGGEKIDPGSSITLKDGGKIYFCCKKCIGKFEKDVEKYAPKLAEQGYPVKAEDLKRS